MNDWLAANRENWNERTALHQDWYGVDEFKAGKNSLLPIELAEIGDVSGKSLLHLQCHFGMDTLSWARRGAQVTGVDFSPVAIARAKQLADEVGLEATFIESEITRLPKVLSGAFDFVFASYGVLTWIPDVGEWMAVAAQFVRPGGVFYLLDGHPLVWMLDDTGERPEPGARYFHDATPAHGEQHGSYVGPPTHFDHPATYQWQHPLGEIVSAVTATGLRLDVLHEWPFAAYQPFLGMQQDEQGYWHLPGDPWPLQYSLRAHRS